MYPNKGIFTRCSYNSFKSLSKLIMGGGVFSLSALLLQFKEAASQMLTVYLSIKYLGVRRDNKLRLVRQHRLISNNKKGRAVSPSSARAVKCCICSIVLLFLVSFSLPLSICRVSNFPDLKTGRRQVKRDSSVVSVVGVLEKV